MASLLISASFLPHAKCYVWWQSHPVKFKAWFTLQTHAHFHTKHPVLGGLSYWAIVLYRGFVPHALQISVAYDWLLYCAHLLQSFTFHCWPPAELTADPLTRWPSISILYYYIVIYWADHPSLYYIIILYWADHPSLYYIIILYWADHPSLYYIIILYYIIMLYYTELTIHLYVILSYYILLLATSCCCRHLFILSAAPLPI